MFSIAFLLSLVFLRLASDRRQTRADLVEDLGYVDSQCLQHCERDDSDHRQDERVLDKRLSLFTRNVHARSEQQVRLVQSCNHVPPLLDRLAGCGVRSDPPDDCWLPPAMTDALPHWNSASLPPFDPSGIRESARERTGARPLAQHQQLKPMTPPG